MSDKRPLVGRAPDRQYLALSALSQSGIIQRNRHHLKPIPNDSDSQAEGGDVVYAHVTITNILVVNQDPESPV